MIATSLMMGTAAAETTSVDTTPQIVTLFDDVGEDHSFTYEVAWLADAGVTRGCNPPDNTAFCPDESVTRGQMAAFLSRALGLSGGHVSFSDTAGHLFENDISALAEAGITRGCNPPDNDRFCPDDSVTRGQIAALLVRAFDLSITDGSEFSDDDDSVFEADIERLAAAGITRGCNPPDNDRFCPDDSVTRGQMAAFLHRAFGSPEPWLRIALDRRSQARDINDNGLVAVELLAGASESRAAVWNPISGTFDSLDFYSFPWDLTDSGFLVGQAEQGFFWDTNTGEVADLIPPGEGHVAPSSVNESGRVAGVWNDSNDNYRTRAFVWSTGDPEITLLETPDGHESSVEMINDAGDIFGWWVAPTTESVPVVWDAASGEATTIPLPGGIRFDLQGFLNDSGEVVGGAFPGAVAFTWKPGGATRVLSLERVEQLLGIGEVRLTTVLDFNNEGVALLYIEWEPIPGHTEGQLAIWDVRSDQLTAVPHERPAGNSSSFINDSTVVVVDAVATRPEWWDPSTGRIHTLAVMPGSTDGGPAGINGSGWVAGWSWAGDGHAEQRSVVWIPYQPGHTLNQGPNGMASSPSAGYGVQSKGTP